jgi:hypothetical protein
MPVVVNRSTATRPKVAAATRESTGTRTPAVLLWATRLKRDSPVARVQESRPGMALQNGATCRVAPGRP